MKRSLVGAFIAAAITTILISPTVAGMVESLLAGTFDPACVPDAFIASGIPAWWISGACLSCPAGVCATFGICLLGYLLAFFSNTASQRAEDGGVLGAAQLKGTDALVRGSLTWDGKSEPTARGFVYGYRGGALGGKYLFEPGKMVFIDGATGSGKSRYLYVPTIDLLTYGDGSHGSEPNTIIVLDVKNELVELCGDELERRGYKVLLLDLQNPSRSSTFDPIRRIVDLAATGRWQDAELAADAVASAIVPGDEDGRDSLWTISARGLLSALVLYSATADGCPDGAKTLATVVNVLDHGTEGTGDDPAADLKALFRSLPDGHPARGRASQFVSSGGNELRSILSTLKSALRVFSSSQVAALVSGSDIDPEAILTEKTALFLHVMDEGSPYNALASVLFDQVWSSVQSVADRNGGRLPRPVTIVGDEWGNLPKVSCLPVLLSLGRSYGILWVGAVQNVAQLNAYGEKAGRPKILANCMVKVFMKLSEAEDRAYATELVGKTTRHTQGSSLSRGAASSSSTSYSEHADDVVHAWEWVSRAPDKDGVVVVKHADNGMPASHAGAFTSPVTDCTNTPTKAHFDLGSREHEHARRVVYQARLEQRAAARQGEEVILWCPEWPEAEGDRDEEGGGGWDGLCLD